MRRDAQRVPALDDVEVAGERGVGRGQPTDRNGRGEARGDGEKRRRRAGAQRQRLEKRDLVLVSGARGSAQREARPARRGAGEEEWPDDDQAAVVREQLEPRPALREAGRLTSGSSAVSSGGGAATTR